MDILLLAEESHRKETNAAAHIKRDLYKSTVKSSDDVHYLRHKENSSEQIVEELVEGLKTAGSVEEMRDTCSALTQHINHECSLTKRRLGDQMKFLRNEREKALKLQQSSECEINYLKKQLEMIQIEYKLVDKSRVKTLQSQLQAAIKERENWKQKAEHLDDVCETIRLVNSLQKSMSKEEDIHQEYAKKMNELEMLAEDQEIKIADLTSQLQDTTLEYNTLIQERNSLAQELVKEREKSTKLQQIVDILRQKVLSNDSSDTLLANSCNSTTHTL